MKEGLETAVMQSPGAQHEIGPPPPAWEPARTWTWDTVGDGVAAAAAITTGAFMIESARTNPAIASTHRCDRWRETCLLPPLRLTSCKDISVFASHLWKVCHLEARADRTECKWVLLTNYVRKIGDGPGPVDASIEGVPLSRRSTNDTVLETPSRDDAPERRYGRRPTYSGGWSYGAGPISEGLRPHLPVFVHLGKQSAVVYRPASWNVLTMSA
jgi:hypothetical protein